MRQERVDYGFDNGLVMTQRQLDADNPYLSHDTKIEIQQTELYAIPKGGNDEKRDAEVAEAMTNPVSIRVGGIAVEAALVGNKQAEVVRGVAYGWGGNLRHPVAIYEGQTLAANAPDELFVIINPPGSGRSDMLPAAVRKEVRHGNFAGYGEQIAQTIDVVAEGRDIQLYGHSFGGRTMTAAVPYFDSHINSLTINDPVSGESYGKTRITRLMRLVTGFGITENNRLKKYIQAEFDPYESELQKNPMKSALRDTAQGTRGGWREQFLTDPIGLAEPGFADDLAEALPCIREKLRVVSPSESAMNRHEAVSDIMAYALAHAKGVPPIVEQLIVHNHSHSFLTIPQALVAVYDENFGVQKHS